MTTELSPLDALPSQQGPQVTRDRFGRPTLPVPGSSKRKPFTRATTVAGAIEETYNIGRWERRLDAIGFSQRPDLVLSVAANLDNRKELDGICDAAKEAARGSAASRIGTATHRLTEIYDSGGVVPTVSPEARGDLDAYAAATTGLHHEAIEQFTVLDEYGIAGTPDRLSTLIRGDEVGFITDIKTGSTVDLGAGKIAAQLAIYSRSLPCNPETGERSEWPVSVSQDWGLIIHLPAGKATAQLQWVDLSAGWQIVELAMQVRSWRRHRDFYRTFEDTADNRLSGSQGGGDYLAQVAAATDVEALYDVWRRAEDAGLYTDALHQACVARKAELSAS